MTTSTTQALAEVAALSRKADIITTLQTFTSRNLIAVPPQDGEQLGTHIGVGANNLNHFIRPWVNRRFREPDGNPRLPPGAIKVTTTFKQLCDLAGA